ncbi:Ig-like domain-containing protein [Flavobacterium algoritolerans]|uniref:Ig-like domain-containing protein n=1 Tax=Flavobacterium algoritolerans TaxID=3041254 RepID=A0ABT6V6P8_9FLAO|nr:Ig-like domain-containing protein [Flavobacterium algoritolerans]MDI5893907.1 Ig-like domain-containing protein [Flavobacterium algoritolerans]
MLKNNLKYSFFLLLLIIVGCAKRGSITGGLKDTIAPVLKVSFPENFNKNFKGNEIKLVFDENIKLKNLNKQLIISPPMKYEPSILPTTPSKTITIKIKDTLQPNTTYSFNFGQSIADNNEGNPLNQFKYVFSTGAYIDSLSLGGTVKSAYDKEVESFVSVMLYDVNDTFKDSVVYNENPRYVTNTLDSLKTFRLENLKAGKYLLVAMKDYNSNNKYNPKTDKIGFSKAFITIPNDTLYELELFKETLPFKTFKPTQASGNRLFLGYEGIVNSAAARPKLILKNNTEVLSNIITKLPKKDSLQVWYKPIKVDSLNLAVAKDKYEANFTFKIKDQKKDTLSISALQTGNLKFRERFTLESSAPLIRIENSKISLINNAKIAVPFTTEYDEFNQKLYFDFKKEPLENYTFEILPGALTDFFEKSNDTLTYKLNTRNTSDYGNLTVVLENVKQFPVIVELTNLKGDVLATEYSEKNTTVEFNLIEPTLYTLRAIYDTNKNKEWDSGNYLEKRQAEEVIYFSKEIDVRANWDVNQVFDLSIPYTPEPKKKTEKKTEKRN